MESAAESNPVRGDQETRLNKNYPIGNSISTSEIVSLREMAVNYLLVQSNLKSDLQSGLANENIPEPDLTGPADQTDTAAQKLFAAGHVTLTEENLFSIDEKRSITEIRIDAIFDPGKVLDEEKKSRLSSEIQFRTGSEDIPLFLDEHDDLLSLGRAREAETQEMIEAHKEQFILDMVREWPGARTLSAQRVFDILIASCLIIMTAPILMLGSVIIMVSIGKPFLFRQQREGRNCVAFDIRKLRTMRAAKEIQDDKGERDRWAQEKARTPVWGHFFRRSRIDELPQLFSVLSGTMSVVGPRPLLRSDQPSLRKARLAMRPGITGWAQVNGGKMLTAEEKLVLDLWFCKNAGPRLYLWILIRSVGVILTGDVRNDKNISKAYRDLEDIITAKEALTSEQKMSNQNTVSSYPFNLAVQE